MLEGIIERYMQKYNINPEALKTEVEKAFNDLKFRLGCIWSEATRTRRANEAQFGRPPMGQWNPHTGQFEEEPRFAPRALVSAPAFFEPELRAEEAAAWKIRAELDLEGRLGRCPSSGFYANIGDSEFKVVLFYADKSATPLHSVPPGVSIPITGYVEKIAVYAKDGETPRYQVKAE